MTEEQNKGVENTTPKTFDEMLNEENYQSEFDKRVAKALDTAKKKWNEEAEAEKSEAEKLAKMKSDEKKDYEIEKANKRANEFEAELNAFKLEREAIKVAEEKGVNSKLLSLIDFKTVKANEVEDQIDNIKEVITAEVEKIVNEKLKENTPKTVVGEVKTNTDMPEFF